MPTNCTRRGLRSLFVALTLFLGVVTTASATADRRSYIPTAADGATVSTSVNGACVGCSVVNEDRVISEWLNGHATLNIPVGVVGGAASLRVDLPSTESSRSRTGFVIRDGTGLLDIEAFGGVTIRTYLDGTLREELSGASLLSVSAFGLDRYAFTLRTRRSFDAVEIEVEGLASLLVDVEVLYALVNRPPDLEKIWARQSTGASVNAGTYGVCLFCNVSSSGLIIDASLQSAAPMTVVAAVAGGVYATVDYGQTLPADTYTGFFLTSEEDLLDVTVLGSLTVQTLSGGSVVDEASGDELTTTLRADGIAYTRFRSSAGFDTVRLLVGSLASADFDISVHAAVAVPVTSGFSAADYDAVAYSDLGDAPTAGPPVLSTAPAAVEAAARGVELGAPAPNPVTGSARLAVALGEAGPVRVAAYDALGREVAVLHDGPLGAGQHAVRFDAAGLAPGAYVVRATTIGGLGAARMVTVTR